MKMSKTLHVLSVIVGVVAVIVAFVGAFSKASNPMFGLSKEHLLLCSGLLFLAAIWFAVSTIHHLMLEDKGRMV